MQLNEALEAVVDATSFLAFARLLAQDRIHEVAKAPSLPPDVVGRGANGWESHTIEAFLQASVAWAEATDVGLTQGLSTENPWKRFATFLYCGKIYE